MRIAGSQSSTDLLSPGKSVEISAPRCHALIQRWNLHEHGKVHGSHETQAVARVQMDTRADFMAVEAD
jgi:hypothetical protein